MNELIRFLTESQREDSHEKYDEMGAMQADHVRRPRMTFRHLNRLRKQHEVKKLEMAAHRKFVNIMYGKKADEGGGF